MVFVTLVSSSRSKERSQIWRRSCPQDSNPDSVVLRNQHWNVLTQSVERILASKSSISKVFLTWQCPKGIQTSADDSGTCSSSLCWCVCTCSKPQKMPVLTWKKRWELCNFHQQDCNFMRPSHIPIKEPCNIFVQVNLTWAVVQQDSQPVLWRHRGHRLEKEQWSRKTSRGGEKRWITQIKKLLFFF